MVDHLAYAQKYIYEPCGLTCSNIRQEVESRQYSACSFKIDSASILFRAAKVTPTKVGQFATIWKRCSSGPIVPFDESDSIDFFVIQVCCNSRFGQFVFPKRVLTNKGYVSGKGEGGKRAMRVYPSWDSPTSKQALKTQQWQLKYFFEVGEGGIVDKDHIVDLYKK